MNWELKYMYLYILPHQLSEYHVTFNSILKRNPYIFQCQLEPWQYYSVQPGNQPINYSIVVANITSAPVPFQTYCCSDCWLESRVNVRSCHLLCTCWKLQYLLYQSRAVEGLEDDESLLRRIILSFEGPRTVEDMEVNDSTLCFHRLRLTNAQQNPQASESTTSSCNYLRQHYLVQWRNACL